MFVASFLNELGARARRRGPRGERACARLWEFLAAAERARAYLRDVLAAHGATELGFEVLIALRAEGAPLPPSVIADRCAILRGTLTDVLGRLEACGLITRRRSASDRRQLLVELTARGREHCERSLEHYARAFLTLAQPLQPDAVPELDAALAELQRRAGASPLPTHEA